MSSAVATVLPAELSIAQRIALLPPDARAAAVERVAGDDETANALLYDWRFWARPKQLVVIDDADHFIVMYESGRGFGKTRTGAETVIAWSRDFSPIALVASTARDARQVMVEGDDTNASILERSPSWWRPTYEPSKTRLTWPNGAVAYTYGADEPGSLRGPQHAKGWADELAKWRRPEAWSNLVLGMRLGSRPQIVVTTTPKPKKFIKKLRLRKSTLIVKGSMYENRANLAPQFIAEIEDAYGGTRLGRQEIEGEYVEEVEGALWKREWIDKHRVRKAPDSLLRVVVSVDPAASSGPDADDTGIIVAASARHDARLRHYYVLADLTCHLGPEGWAGAAIDAALRHKADYIVGEVNNGGDMVASTIRVAAASRGVSVRVKKVSASRGKVVRAEPSSLLYEQGRVHHVGEFDELEDQLCSYTTDVADTEHREDFGSPDRGDALVWALTELDKGASFGAS